MKAVDIDLRKSPLPLGSKFLKYDVLDVIGKGGFAWVFRGRDEFMARDVAIKILHREGGVTSDMLRRGQTEAKLLGRMRHPNIVEVYDAGVSDSNHLYIIMELLLGRPLHLVLQQVGRLTLSEGLPLFIQIASAFEKAHQMGAIHRDIKPENIFITEGNLGKVLDFGIAKITDVGSGMTTNQGMMIGTLKYMSPEQVQGQRVSPCSDIYCLGLVMYESFCGMHPCFAFTPDATYRALAYKQIVEIPPSLASLVSGIPKELSRLIDRCISKKTTERFQSMQELHAALCNCWERVQREASPNEAPPRCLTSRRAARLEPVRQAQPATTHLSGRETALLAPGEVMCSSATAQRVEPARMGAVTQSLTPANALGRERGAAVIAPGSERSAAVIAPAQTKRIENQPEPKRKPAEVSSRPRSITHAPVKRRIRLDARFWASVVAGAVLGSSLFGSLTHWYLVQKGAPVTVPIESSALQAEKRSP